MIKLLVKVTPNTRHCAAYSQTANRRQAAIYISELAADRHALERHRAPHRENFNVKPKKTTAGGTRKSFLNGRAAGR